MEKQVEENVEYEIVIQTTPTFKELEKKVRELRELIELINTSPDDFVVVRERKII